MKNICIIPARGGSKRIPRKNIKNFIDKPIISYSIKAALDSNLFDEVMVSTDDNEIATIALAYGASIPFLRSTENSNDFAGTSEVLIEVIEKYQAIGEQIDWGCCIYPCAPFVNTPKLIQAYDLFYQQNLDTVFPVCEYSTPIQRALKIEHNKTIMFNPENLEKRSQDLEKAYYDAGQFYFFRTNSLITNKKLWTNNTNTIIIDALETQDIDNETDWILAELKFKMLHNIK